MAQRQLLVKGRSGENESLAHNEFEDNYQSILKNLAEQDKLSLRKQALILGGGVMARILKRLDFDRRIALMAMMEDDALPAILAELDQSLLGELAPSLGVKRIADALHQLPTDDGMAIAECLPDAMRKSLWRRLSIQEKRFLEAGLAYPAKSAGRLMQREIVAIPSHWSVSRTLAYLKKESSLPKDFFDVQIVDPRLHPLGVVSLNQLVRSHGDSIVTSLMHNHLRPISAMMEQEEVAFLFRDQDIASHPVVDEMGRLVGIITIDDVVDVIDDEAEEDFMQLGGVGAVGTSINLWRIMRSRVTWLSFNLCATFATALVIAQFSASIEKIIALAILMPMVASMSGIAAVQSLTVTVRALAMKELGRDNLMRSITREILVNVSSGIFLGSIAVVVIWSWFHDAGLALLVFGTMIANLALAGFLGASMPWFFNRLNIDPAIASGPCVTAITDIIGFLTFLGLATLYLI